MQPSNSKVVASFYNKLFAHFGPQHWWPGRTRFEIITGAILTQNTNWGNVEKALANLKKRHLLTPAKIKNIPFRKLARLIKPSGYFNVKARRLKNFIDFLYEKYSGDLSRMGRQSVALLRKELLSVNGIGPETADSILLYAFSKPVFVVDAYTKRLLYRHALISQNADYDDMQSLFMNSIGENKKIFNEYHALVVRLGKDICRPRPQCHICPLNSVRYSLETKCTVCHRYLSNEQTCPGCHP